MILKTLLNNSITVKYVRQISSKVKFSKGEYNFNRTPSLLTNRKMPTRYGWYCRNEIVGWKKWLCLTQTEGSECWSVEFRLSDWIHDFLGRGLWRWKDYSKHRRILRILRAQWFTFRQDIHTREKNKKNGRQIEQSQ